MEIDPTIYKALYKATMRSTNRRHLTGCVIVKKREIISNGCAHASSFRLRELATIHSEIHALARSRHLNLTNAIAYVMTMARKSGNLTLSMPCLTCSIAMRSAGIKTAIYSVENGKFEIIDLEKDLSHLKVYKRRKDL